MITLDPLLVTPPSSAAAEAQLQPSSVRVEDHFLLSYASVWLKELAEFAPYTANRRYKLFATTSSGKLAFVCRYLTPQVPPAGYGNRRSVLHLVSMIPFLQDTQAFLQDIDLWCTSKQCWDMGCGDEEEHGVMLANYLLALQRGTTASVKITTAAEAAAPVDPKQEIYLVLGKAVPEGQNTVYVLMRYEHSVHSRCVTLTWYLIGIRIGSMWRNRFTESVRCVARS